MTYQANETLKDANTIWKLSWDLNYFIRSMNQFIYEQLSPEGNPDQQTQWTFKKKYEAQIKFRKSSHVSRRIILIENHVDTHTCWLIGCGDIDASKECWQESNYRSEQPCRVPNLFSGNGHLWGKNIECIGGRSMEQGSGAKCHYLE